jgi:hypothetical protein
MVTLPLQITLQFALKKLWDMPALGHIIGQLIWGDIGGELYRHGAHDLLTTTYENSMYNQYF